MKIKSLRTDVGGLMWVYHLNSSVTMNAAAPKRDAPAVDQKKNTITLQACRASERP
jgi:hypothetical protein